MVEARDGVSVKISGEHANAVFSQLRGGILPNEMDEARLRAPWRSKASSVMDLAALVQDRDFSPNDFVVAAHRKSTLGLASGGRLIQSSSSPELARTLFTRTRLTAQQLY